MEDGYGTNKHRRRRFVRALRPAYSHPPALFEEQFNVSWIVLIWVNSAGPSLLLSVRSMIVVFDIKRKMKETAFVIVKQYEMLIILNVLLGSIPKR
jgi:hypothetical protein